MKIILNHRSLFKISKTAVITGASRGIGKAIAEEFTKNGCSLALLSRNYQELDTTFQEFGRKHNARGYAINIQAYILYLDYLLYISI